MNNEGLSSVIYRTNLSMDKLSIEGISRSSISFLAWLFLSISILQFAPGAAIPTYYVASLAIFEYLSLQDEAFIQRNPASALGCDSRSRCASNFSNFCRLHDLRWGWFSCLLR